MATAGDTWHLHQLVLPLLLFSAYYPSPAVSFQLSAPLWLSTVVELAATYDLATPQVLFWHFMRQVRPEYTLLGNASFLSLRPSPSKPPGVDGVGLSVSTRFLFPFTFSGHSSLSFQDALHLLCIKASMKKCRK